MAATPQDDGSRQLFGLGIPNLWLEADYAGARAAAWRLRVETLVPIGDEQELAKVKGWLASQAAADKKSLADPLVPKVPGGGARHMDAKRMVAAAFGFALDKTGKIKEP